jgi:two-component system sensor histidine kinase KdpD
VAGIAGLALVCSRVVHVNHTTAALAFLLAILAIATRWGLVESIAASVAAVLCFNYFFVPPVGTFMIADPDNWVALFAFVVTAVVGSHLSASAKRRALEAIRREREMERLYALSRALLQLDAAASTPAQVAEHVARVFGFGSVAYLEISSGRIYRAGAGETSILESALRDSARGSGSFHDPARNVSAVAVTLAGERLGILAVEGSTSMTALAAVASVAAAALERARALDLAGRHEAARQSQELKSTLLDALAHEFKTPLTAIKAAVSAVASEDDGPRNELLTVIEEEADRLNSLVDEAIQTARIEAGNLRLDRQGRAVADLVARALASMRASLSDREVRVEIPDRCPNVAVDPDLFELALRQLIGNAVKYSRADSPIAIRARPGEDTVVFTVADQGPGIPERERERIFEKFYRGRQSAALIPGAGMGLTIARDIVEAHGGRIWVEARRGGGSEFSFTVPAVAENVRA